MGKPAATLGCYHTCPDKTGKKKHIGGVTATGSEDVAIGGLPAARVGDKLVCRGPADTIVQGSSSVFINGKPAARVTDMTDHGGTLVEGNPTVTIGDAGYVATAGGMTCLADLSEPEKLAIEEEQNPEPVNSPPLPYEPSVAMGNGPASPKPDVARAAERYEEEEEEEQVLFDEWLHVEVLGENHPDGHALRIMTPDYVDVDGAIDSTHGEEKTDDSVIHKWLWKKSSEKNPPKTAVALEIMTEQGGPIRLPVFDNAYGEPRKDPRQRYILAPFVPLTTIERRGGAGKGVVTSRAGYLYIFRYNLLWREIQIVRDENGELTYRDVHLDDYRSAPGERLSADRREPTGIALDEVWLPVRYLYSSLAYQQLDYRVAYSEVQWSAGRVWFLEQNVREQEDRAQVIVDHGTRWNRYQARLMPLQSAQEVQPQRAREPLLEEFAPCAYKLLTNLSGHYARDSFNDARAEQQALMKGREHAEQAWQQSQEGETGLGDSAGLRWAAFQDLQQVEAGQFSYPESHQKVWNSLPASTDILNVPRRRKIFGLVVYDELYELRLATARVTHAMEYQASIREWLSSRTHFQSAELIQQTILPVRLGGKPNPMREFSHKLDLSPNGTFLQTLSRYLRAIAVNCIKYNQEPLWRLASQSHVQRRFADLLSLEGEDYLSGFMLAGGLFEKLQHDPEAADKPWLAKANGDGDTTLEGEPLTRSDFRFHRDGSRLVLDIVKETSGHPLHDMLFPSEDVVPLAEALDTTAMATENPGDGRFRPALFAALAGQEKFSSSSGLQTPEARLLVEIQDRRKSGAFSATRTVIKALESLSAKVMEQFDRAYDRVMRDLVRFDFELHGPLARAMKGMNPHSLGELVVKPYGEKSMTMLPLGIEDPEIGLRYGLTDSERLYVNSHNHSGKFFGEVSTSDGRLMAHTDPQRVPSGVEQGEFARLNVFMAPAGSVLARNYREVRAAISRNRAIGEALDSMGLPYVVMGLELWNLNVLVKREDELRRTRGNIRTNAEMTSTYAHLSFAAITVLERLASHENWLTRSLNVTVLDIDRLVAEGRLTEDIAKFLPRAISVRMAAVSLLGVIDFGIRVSDAHHYWQQNQTASSVAMGVSALGTLMGTWAGVSLMNTASAMGAAAVLGLSNPAGWVVLGLGITLAVGGAVLASALEKRDLELWIEHGPFGQLTAGSDNPKIFGHIRGESNEQEAFYRLANILAGVHLSAERYAVSDELAIATARNLLTARGEATTDQAVSQVAESLMKVNLRVKVRSNLIAITGQGALEFDVRRLRAYSKVRFGALGPSQGTEQWDIQTAPRGHWWLYETALPDGVEYWFHSPEQATVEQMQRTGKDETFYWIVRARLKTTLGSTTDYVFPAPALEDNLSFNDVKHGKVDFRKKKDFWINQIINPASLASASGDYGAMVREADTYV